MIANLKCSALLLSLVAPIFLSGCASDTGVSQAEYDNVVAENQQLRQQAALDQDHIKRLQSAIKYTVNSDLLFPPGGYELSDAGKDIIAKMARVPGAASTGEARGERLYRRCSRWCDPTE